MDMTKVWTAQHGRVYLHAMIDCCTGEPVGWSLELRCRDEEAIACVEAAAWPAAFRPANSPSAPTMAASSPPATSADTCLPSGSAIGVAATAILESQVFIES